MRSDIIYEEGVFWPGDDTKTYYMPDLRRLALNHTSHTSKYQGRFHYNNYHPLYLGIILERSTGMPVADYLHIKLWDKIGAENDASWSLDSDKTGFEKMESGINFKAIDFIKIGSMLLNGGQWNGQHIISEDWILKSTSCQFPLQADNYIGSFLENRNIGYQYMWYSTLNANGQLDYFALGKYGQYLYVSPANDVVILRTGSSYGGVDDWPLVLRGIATHIERL